MSPPPAPSTPAPTATILIIDDEREHAEVMCEALSRLGHRCETRHSLPEATSALNQRRFDVVVTDLRMDGERDGLEVLRLTRTLDPPPPTVLVTAHNDVPTSRQAIQEGAYDYIVKPLDLEEFRAVVGRAVEKAHLRRQNAELNDLLSEHADAMTPGFEGIVGRSLAMREVVRIARQVADSDIAVLVLGESGTGKELIARAIHAQSPRRRNRLVALNCAGLSESILEDELFGHVRGAFTGAQSSREGRFEHADGGTLFLDEIGDMPSAMQAKLLRVLENGEVVRLGSNEPIRVDVRFISATNRGLDEMVDGGKFRQDLYFRIKGATVTVPPLRERREDIPLLAHYFLTRAAERYKRPVPELDAAMRQRLMAFGWPGNVRQLKNMVENLLVMSTEGVIRPDSLPPELRPAVPPSGPMQGLVGISIEAAERELIRNTLRLTNGNREQAAEMLGIGERTLYRKIKEYGL